MKFHIVVAVPILVASWAVLTSGSAELVVPLIPAAALHAIVANLPLVAGAAALVKGAATTGAYLYLRNRGLIDVSYSVDHHNGGHAPAGYGHHAAHHSAVASDGYTKRNHQSHHHGGHHNHQQDHGHHYEKELLIATSPSENVGVSVNPQLEKIMAMDRLGCGFRLMCELASLPPNQLEQDEKLLLALYGSEKPGQGSGKMSFGYASFLGRTSPGGRACSRVYSRCPHPRRLVMDVLRDATFHHA